MAWVFPACHAIFKRIEQSSAARYHVTEECKETDRDTPAETIVRIYEIAFDGSFKSVFADGDII